MDSDLNTTELTWHFELRRSPGDGQSIAFIVDGHSYCSCALFIKLHLLWAVNEALFVYLVKDFSFLDSRCQRVPMTRGHRSYTTPTWRPVLSLRSHGCPTGPSSSSTLLIRYPISHFNGLHVSALEAILFSPSYSTTSGFVFRICTKNVDAGPACVLISLCFKPRYFSVACSVRLCVLSHNDHLWPCVILVDGKSSPSSPCHFALPSA